MYELCGCFQRKKYIFIFNNLVFYCSVYNDVNYEINENNGIEI